jgi:hypothetical protein
MTVYVGETWSKYYDSPEGSWEVSKVFFDKGLADEWANQDENRMWMDYEVESPPIPIIPEGSENSRLLRNLDEIWKMRTEPIVQLISELRNEYYESLCKADPKLKDYGNDFFTSKILDLINSQVFDKIGKD